VDIEVDGMNVGAPALTNASKVASMATGGAVGLGIGVGTHYALPSPETKDELQARGIETISDRQARATIAPIAFVAAAAVGAGIGKRSSTAALTTASLGAAAMLASTGASAMINAGKDSADDYLRTIGIMTGVAGAGFAVGAMDEIPLNRAKLVGLGLMGVAAGALLPETAGIVTSTPEKLARSFEHRER
jgi:hypothetical protein